MRTLLIFVLSCAAGTAGWGWWLSQPQTGGEQQTAASAAQAEIGLRRMLAAQDVLIFEDIVVGIAPQPDLRDFRGRVSQKGHLRPIFGQARRVCPADETAQSCWQLVHLEIDGTVADLEALGQQRIADVPAPAAAPARAQAPSPSPVPSLSPGDPLITADIPNAETAKAPEPTEQPEPQAQTLSEIETPGAADAETAADKPKATHVVGKPLINTRTGPGTQHQVVTQLKAGAQLKMLEQSEDWGRFVIMSGATQGQEVWAALRILTPMTPEPRP